MGVNYFIKGELELKLGGGLLPCACDLRIDGVLADEETARLCGLCEHPRCMEGAVSPLPLSEFCKSVCDLKA